MKSSEITCVERWEVVPNRDKNTNIYTMFPWRHCPCNVNETGITNRFLLHEQKMNQKRSLFFHSLFSLTDSVFFFPFLPLHYFSKELLLCLKFLRNYFLQPQFAKITLSGGSRIVTGGNHRNSNNCVFLLKMFIKIFSQEPFLVIRSARCICDFGNESGCVLEIL